MSQPLLSILIPTVVGREDVCDWLFNKVKGGHAFTEVKIGADEKGVSYHLAKGITREICVIISKDNKELTIGEKREELYKKSTTPYSFMVDDDDDISEDAIDLILEAIKNNPDVDCVTFQEHCLMYGKHFKSNHSLSYSGWYGDGSHVLHDGFSFHRSPFYKDVIKTSIAQSVPFHHIRYGEDVLFSKDLYKHLKTEVHIDKDLYFYIYDPKDSHQERYGIKD